jgi:hypothetical protein
MKDCVGAYFAPRPFALFPFQIEIYVRNNLRARKQGSARHYQLHLQLRGGGITGGNAWRDRTGHCLRPGMIEN